MNKRMGLSEGTAINLDGCRQIMSLDVLFTDKELDFDKEREKYEQTLAAKNKKILQQRKKIAGLRKSVIQLEKHLNQTCNEKNGLEKKNLWLRKKQIEDQKERADLRQRLMNQRAVNELPKTAPQSNEAPGGVDNTNNGQPEVPPFNEVTVDYKGFIMGVKQHNELAADGNAGGSTQDTTSPPIIKAVVEVDHPNVNIEPKGMPRQSQKRNQVRARRCREYGKTNSECTQLLQHICDTSKKRVMNKTNIETHKVEVDEVRPFACKFPGCGRTFRQRAHLGNHMRTHKN